MKRSLLQAAAFAITLAGFAWPSSAQENRLEYQVKAAFLYNFAKFVDWPQDAFDTANGSFSLCIVGEDPFGSSLDRTVDGRTVHGRPIIVRRKADLATLRRCHLVFISSSEQERLAQIMLHLKGAAVLTVAEWPHFADEGGVIRLLVDSNKVRFEINTAESARARLRVSSQLLKLALSVKK